MNEEHGVIKMTYVINTEIPEIFALIFKGININPMYSKWYCNFEYQFSQN